LASTAARRQASSPLTRLLSTTVPPRPFLSSLRPSATPLSTPAELMRLRKPRALLPRLLPTLLPPRLALTLISSTASSASQPFVFPSSLLSNIHFSSELP
jgi:hypothetical protein